MQSLSTPLQAGIYSRESKDKRKSIDDQAEESCEAALERRWNIVRKYSDGASASRFGRKGRGDWQRLLADLEAGNLDVVVAWEPSRADRDLETWVPFVSRCRKHGVLVHLTGDGDTLDPRNPSHWHRLITGGVDAAMESEKVSKRTRRGTARSAAAGKAHGPAPYGYHRVIVGEQQTPHGPRPVKEQRKSEAAPIVIEIVERVARGEPISAIVRALNGRELPAPRGEQWTRDSVRNIVRNVAYIGQRSHRTTRDGEPATEARYDAVWPALVDRDVFYRAQAVLDQPGRRSAKPGQQRWLLSYLATSPCGSSLHAAPDKGRRLARYECSADSCAGVAVWAADEMIRRIILARLARPDARGHFLPDDAASAAAKIELADLRALLDSHYDEAAANRLSASGLAAMERRLLPLIAEADRRARPASTPGALVELLDAGGDRERVRRVWDALPVAGRREVISTLAEIRIGKASRRMSRWASDDERLEAATQQLGPSCWVGDEQTWADLLASVPSADL